MAEICKSLNQIEVKFYVKNEGKLQVRNEMEGKSIRKKNATETVQLRGYTVLPAGVANAAVGANTSG